MSVPSLTIPTPAQYAEMPWHARAALVTRLVEWERENNMAREQIRQRRNMLARRRGARRSPANPAATRALAAAILESLPVEHPEAVAFRREVLIEAIRGAA